MACEAITLALRDAGIDIAEVDGLVRYDFDRVDEASLTLHLGLENLRWASHTGHGGVGGNAVVAHAAAAIASGAATTVVCYRALNGRSATRYGQGETWTKAEVGGMDAFQMPWGVVTPAHRFALLARRHMIEFGTTSRQFGEVAVAMRHHASMNPHALMRTPITLDDHADSPLLVDPLRLYDFCIESDGACATIVTDRTRALKAPQPPAWILGASHIIGPRAAGVVFSAAASSAASAAATAVYQAAGVAPSSVDAVMVYDAFTPLVIMTLEEFGFCARGAGGEFVEGGRIHVGGDLPVNPHGGNHSEAHLHGLTHVMEAVRQLRGTASAQVGGADVILSCCSLGQFASAVIVSSND